MGTERNCAIIGELRLVCRALLQCRRNEEFAGRSIQRDVQHVGFTAELAVFYIALACAGGFVD